VRAAVLRDQQAALKAAADRAQNRVDRGLRISESDKITILVSKNPKRGTAAQRFALYRPGMSVGDYKAAVGNAQALADLRWDVKKGFIRIDNPRS
jgi:hypothetical protein